MAKSKTNIFDVAELAGVSIKTVSRVINNEPNVQQKTREKVEKAVAQLNYRPNASARSLSSKKSYIIGLVYENPHEFSYMKDVLNGALEACAAEGYSLLLQPLSLPDDNVGERVRTFALQTRMEGIILPPPVCDLPQVARVVEDLGIATARISPKRKSEGVSVFSNDERAIYEVTEYLRSLGHRRIAFIKGHPDHGATEQRLSGYCLAIESEGQLIDDSLIREGFFTFESGQDAARELLALDVPPTAIIASNDDMAAGVLFVANERGIAVPAELSIVGFDDTPVASHVWPQLSTIRQPITRMVTEATRKLVGEIRGKGKSAEDFFDCELVIRDSTGPI